MICAYCDSLGGSLRCSGCKSYYYCNERCQKADWKEHKKTCKMQQAINSIMEKKEAEAAARPPQRPADDRCTGCGLRFDDEDYYCDEECSDCGYMTCESCSAHHSKGTCYCPNSNFGHPYCEREPAWYHADGRTGKSYTGDRHPEIGYQYEEEAFEKEPRACGNCGQVARMLRKELC